MKSRRVTSIASHRPRLHTTNFTVDPAAVRLFNRADWTVPRFQTTVAEDNPEHPADTPIVVVIFTDTPEEPLPEWERDDPISDLNDVGVTHYLFPAPRLAPLEPTAATDSDFDADANADSDGDPSPPDAATSLSSSRADEDEDQVHASVSADSDPNTNRSTENENSIPTSQPSAAVRALKQRLEDGGMTTELEADDRTIRARKLSETYRVCPGEVLNGDGALRNLLEEIVDAADRHVTN